MSGRPRPGRGLAGFAAILAAAALWGSTGTVAHFAPSGATPASVGAARIILGGTLLVLVALRRRPAAEAPDAGPLLRGRRPAALAIGAVGVAGYQVCFFSAVRLTGVAIGTVVAIGSGPVFAGLISLATRTARVSWRWVIATGGAIAGCSVLLLGGRAAGVSDVGAGVALVAGLCYACYAVCAGRLIGGGSSERSVMAVIFGAGAVLLLPVLAASSPGWLLTWRGAAVVAELGVLATAVAYLLYGYGLRTVHVPVAVTLGLAEPVIAALLGALVLGERLTGTAAAGVLLVGCSLVVLAVPAARRPDPA